MNSLKFLGLYQNFLPYDLNLLLTLLLESSALFNFFYPMPHKFNLHIHRWSYAHTVAYANSFSYWPLTFQLSFKSEIKFSFESTNQKYSSFPPIFPLSFHDKMITFIHWGWMEIVFVCLYFSVINIFKVYNESGDLSRFQIDPDKTYLTLNMFLNLSGLIFLKNIK